MPRPFTDDEIKGNPMREWVADLETRLEALEQLLHTRLYPEVLKGREEEKPTKATWSQRELEPKDWEPVEGKQGKVFRNPLGIWCWVDKGEVPRDIMEKFNIKQESDEETP